ncbi:4-coumarate-CoA ligase [Marssonina coronariae]|uniref:4-coumarate-CoA ligase n=1 Tax=Diplocarpon coronariae TaxID=2795749 RepID=A0A218Z0A9_9HELO|nr:4-coumarate-CoA ligase [Marssonina coronariae]
MRDEGWVMRDESMIESGTRGQVPLYAVRPTPTKTRTLAGETLTSPARPPPSSLESGEGNGQSVHRKRGDLGVMPVRATVALESEGKRERVWWCEEVTRNPGGRGSVNESGGEKKRLGIPGGESAWPPTPSARQDDCLESQPASCILIYLPTPTHIRASRRRGRSTASPRGDWRAPAMRAASCREIASHRIPSHRIASHRIAPHPIVHNTPPRRRAVALGPDRGPHLDRGSWDSPSGLCECLRVPMPAHVHALAAACRRGEAIPTWAASSPLAAARLGILEKTQAPSPHTTRQRDTTARLPTTSYDVGTAPDRPPAHEQGGTDDGGEGTSPRLSSTDLLPLPEAQRIRTGSSRSYRRTSDETMDILSWTFARSPEGEDEHKPVSPSSARKPLGSKATTREESEERLTGLPQLYIDAANPHRSLSYARTRSQVRRLIAGFARHGVQKGDCVCVVSLNDVRIRAAATLSERRLTRLTLTRARSTTPLCTSPSSAPALALRVLTRGYVDRTARVPFLSSSASPAVLRISPESARDLATRGRRRPGDIDSSDLPSPRCTQEDRLIPRQYTPRELAHHLRITGATHVLTSLKALPAAQAAAAECQIPPPRVFLLNFRHEAVAPGLQSWTALLAHGERAWRAGEEVAAGDLEAAAYVSTSGTSGLPKAAVIGHGYLISQGQVVEGLVGAGERPKISSLIAIPPFHVFTMPVQHALPLRTGTPAYIMPRFEDERFAGALREFEISHAIVVPPILMALSRRAATELASLQTVFVGGSCATAGMQRQLYAKLAPAARIVQVYGMTETGWAACWARAARDGTGSVGQPVAGTRLRLADPAGRGITSDGQTGEIQINTLHAMTGYLGDPAATAAARTPDGWTRTGDVGYVRRGDWYIIDRTKDLIKVRGWQVSPAEIEAALLEHPGVRDAGVVAAAAADGWGEVPWAFVVRSGAGAVDELGVRAFLGARLARYKNVGGVEFVAEIPRNPTGKILRRVLRDAQSQLQGERPGSGGGQAAAIEYASALKDLYAYQVSRASTGVTLVGGKAVPTAEKVQSAGTLVPERGGKRKPYAATSFFRWRKLRGLARSSSRAVAPNNS